MWLKLKCSGAVIWFEVILTPCSGLVRDRDRYIFNTTSNSTKSSNNGITLEQNQSPYI